MSALASVQAATLAVWSELKNKNEEPWIWHINSNVPHKKVPDVKELAGNAEFGLRLVVVYCIFDIFLS